MERAANKLDEDCASHVQETQPRSYRESAAQVVIKYETCPERAIMGRSFFKMIHGGEWEADFIRSGALLDKGRDLYFQRKLLSA